MSSVVEIDKRENDEICECTLKSCKFLIFTLFIVCIIIAIVLYMVACPNISCTTLDSYIMNVTSVYIDNEKNKCKIITISYENFEQNIECITQQTCGSNIPAIGELKTLYYDGGIKCKNFGEPNLSIKITSIILFVFSILSLIFSCVYTCINRGF